MRKKSNEFIIETDFILQSLSNSSNDYIYIYDFQNNTYMLSENMAEDFTLPKTGTDFFKNWNPCIHLRDSDRVTESFSQLIIKRKSKISIEYQVQNMRGNYIWINEKTAVHYNQESDEPELLIGVLHNLATDGEVDSVTGLFIHDKCEELFALNLQNKVESYGSIMLLGMDDFTTVNTLNTHSFGDLVLRTTALDILNFLPEDTFMYRFDGDQFLVFAEKKTKREMLAVYSKIQQYTSMSHKLNDSSYRFTISAGIVSFPEDGYTWSDLEKALSSALKKAKEIGKNQCIQFEKEMLEQRMYEQSLGSYMADSIAHNFQGFKVVYQPMCHAQNLRVKGAEALLRFETPTGDLISPIQFIPLLEHSGLIHAVGLWVLEQAICACKKWVYYMDDFVMNVNVSYLQLHDLNFCNQVEMLLKKYDLDICHLTLELTESYFITDAVNINKSMKRMKELHLQVAMDDFGTGYSSLARLSQFNVDIVKIDRSFIQSLHKSKYNYDFVDSVVRLCHNVGMQVCVEGVETKEEQTSICLLNADYIQGFYVAKPVDEHTFLTKFVMQPQINDALIVTPDSRLFHNQLVGDKDVLLSMMDASPLALNFWNRDMQILACNAMVLQLFETESFEDFKKNFLDFSPEYQPDGEKSRDLARLLVQRAFDGETVNNFWMHCSRSGAEIPVEITLVRIPYMNDFIVASFTRDMREQREMETRIEKFNLRLKAILDASPLCLNLWNSKFDNIMCNQEAISLFGLQNEQDYTEHFFNLSPKYQPDGQLSSQKAQRYIKEAFANGRNIFFWLHCDLKGKEIPSEITLVRIDGLGDDGGPLVVGFTRDIREQLANQQMEKKMAERIRAVLNTMPLACVLWTLDQQIMDCNTGAVTLFGAEDKQDIISNFDSFIPINQPDNSDSRQKKNLKFNEVLQSGFSIFEWVYQNKKGEHIPCEVTLVKITSEYEEMIVAYSRDLRELHQTLELNDRLAQLAYYDLLTGCATRIRFMEKLETYFQTQKTTPLAYIIFDIDYFKTINDTYGHTAGDMVLKRVSKCIDNLLPQNALLGRFGGDEFTILLPELDRDALELLLQTLVEHVAHLDLHYEDYTFSTTISAGATFKTSGDKDSEELLSRADKALYNAKARGRSCGFIL